MRLIDADALKAHVMKEGYDQQQFCYPCKAMIWAIDSAPTVEEQKSGKWIKDGPILTCPLCGNRVYKLHHDPANYCEKCGARLKNVEMC